MLICEIDKKKDTIKIIASGPVTEITKDLSIELSSLLKNGILPEFIVAALVNAVNDDMKQDEYNQCCEVISDLLKAIKDK